MRFYLNLTRTLGSLHLAQVLNETGSIMDELHACSMEEVAEWVTSAFDDVALLTNVPQGTVVAIDPPLVAPDGSRYLYALPLADVPGDMAQFLEIHLISQVSNESVRPMPDHAAQTRARRNRPGWPWPGVD